MRTRRLIPPCLLALACVAAPAQAERNPPGDIPDSQVFITFLAPSGYRLEVPEGWARTDLEKGFRFSDRYNAIELSIASAAQAPSAQEAGREVPGHATGPARNISLPAGPALRLAFAFESESNSVTGKRIAMQGERYLLFQRGRLATLDLSAPRGADNADQWQRIARSFRWD